MIDANKKGKRKMSESPRVSYSSRQISKADLERYATQEESQLYDRKGIRIRPSKLSQTFSAMANADGGEIFLGIEDDGTFMGFENQEGANNHLFEAARLMSEEFYTVEFVYPPDENRCGVLFTIDRHPGLVEASDGSIYVRIGAQKQEQTGESLERLRRSKGGFRQELVLTQTDAADLVFSKAFGPFADENHIETRDESYFRKQRLSKNGLATVAALVLFDDMPQAEMPSSAVKIYRYETSGNESRDHLSGKPITVEGPLIDLIRDTEKRVTRIVSEIPKLEESGFEKVTYPTTTLHEILTNAVLHRDYGINDYVHVRIFDNRVEVDSPGRLHGHVTVANILDERSARNPLIQRILNKFPDAPNQDIGEGLNSAFQAMEELRLQPPEIRELEDRVRVIIRHEPLASPETAIMEYAVKNGSINNSQAREVTKIQQERTIRRYFEDLMAAGHLERRGTARATRYLPTEQGIKFMKDQSMKKL
ncbi:ATP-binding protein [Corynebacterium wankanglinii]|uniref:ATP-dependent DNA helicase RecG n=1 Tax=Corynebacterium wankanglinii TaxID=2735136 RepID=A0A838CI31_9CORY|nr:ATP-binding protein [Corynebacterium wankanglinii]MBA1834597.1 ATP-dependent DNA helicase RecG [Corynebacterium wankanglinii]